MRVPLALSCEGHVHLCLGFRRVGCLDQAEGLVSLREPLLLLLLLQVAEVEEAGEEVDHHLPLEEGVAEEAGEGEVVLHPYSAVGAAGEEEREEERSLVALQLLEGQQDAMVGEDEQRVVQQVFVKVAVEDERQSHSDG